MSLAISLSGEIYAAILVDDDGNVVDTAEPVDIWKDNLWNDGIGLIILYSILLVSFVAFLWILFWGVRKMREVKRI